MIRVEIAAHSEAMAERAATLIAAHAQRAVADRDGFRLAVSGGRTPRRTFEILATMDLPWQRVRVFQVDERIAPSGHPDRNLVSLRASLADRVPLALHPMPVDGDVDPSSYARTLSRFCGAPPVLDLIHLGLGSDGHTASLLPGDPALEVLDADVTVSRPYQGWPRMTLTLAAINRARSVLWIVSGADKRDAVAAMRRGDTSLPAGRVSVREAVLVADPSAMGR
jgi:6-phosphogluconolactonase